MRITIIKLIKKLLRRTRSQKPSAEADYIIPRTQHTISKSEISSNALKVLNRLNSAGFQAFLVGGSVRDLLLKKVPKDFDIATNATPTQIKNLFRNGRIIGRRFKLVHIIFHREIIEAATFRGEQNNIAEQQLNEQGMLVRDNVYGTLEQDAWRRDFTINSLYYNLQDASLVDRTDGFQDIQARLVRIIGNPEVRYREDPVRMLRAIRFSAKLHFTIAPETAAPLKELSSLILHVSSARLFDEIIKLFQCGEAEAVYALLLKYDLFKQLFSQTEAILSKKETAQAFIENAFKNTDTRVKENKPITPAFLFAVLLWFPLLEKATQLQQTNQLPPLIALEQAMYQIIAEQNKIIFIPKRLTQIMREIWLLQFRFNKRLGERAFNTLHHPRFRAAYDFMALRALAGDESVELAQWWTTFQEVSPEEQHQMIDTLSITKPKRKKKKLKPAHDE